MGTRHLEGKVAIVTGGAGGMGSWIVKTYAEQGAKVVVADTGADVEGRMGADPTRVNALVDEVRAAGGEATGVVGDIAEMDVAEDVVRTAIDTFGGLDILVCAHGILRERMIFNMTEDDWDPLIRVHLKGCFATTKYASTYWRSNRDRGGRIIYFTSTAGIHGAAGQPNYSAAHAGKLGLMRSNARALARYGVTCNSIAPMAATRMTDRGRPLGEDGRPHSEGAAGTDRDPRNLAPLTVWLGSDASAHVNGRVFSAAGHRVTLFDQPTIERTLWNDEPYFDIDTLFEDWPNTLAFGGYPMERTPTPWQKTTAE